LYGAQGAFGVRSASDGVGVTTFASAGFAHGCAGSRAAAPKQSGTSSRRARASNSSVWSLPPSQVETTDHLRRPNGMPASTGVNAAVKVLPSSASVDGMRVALPGGSSGTRRRIGVPLNVAATHSAVRVVP
jgi:hypothetical protein